MKKVKLTKSEAHVIHGHTKGKKTSTEYCTWHHFRNRCMSPSNARYADYGGRGITVCERWAHSFQNFYDDMGPRPSLKHTLDRIDNSKGYSPENCAWRTVKEQNNNRRSVIFIDGVPLSELAEKHGIPRKTLWKRYTQYGWRGERLLQPVRVR